jgi:hypothetical protein
MLPTLRVTESEIKPFQRLFWGIIDGNLDGALRDLPKDNRFPACQQSSSLSGNHNKRLATATAMTIDSSRERKPHVGPKRPI